MKPDFEKAANAYAWEDPRIGATIWKHKHDSFIEGYKFCAKNEKETEQQLQAEVDVLREFYKVASEKNAILEKENKELKERIQELEKQINDLHFFIKVT